MRVIDENWCVLTAGSGYKHIRSERRQGPDLGADTRAACYEKPWIAPPIPTAMVVGIGVIFLHKTDPNPPRDCDPGMPGSGALKNCY